METHPKTLLNGTVVCETCPRATEERGTIARHLEALSRCRGRDERKEYLERVEACEGKVIAGGVQAAFLAAWEARRAAA